MDTTASMNFIADLDLYKTEKPYNCKASDVEGGEITNLVFNAMSDVVVRDVRGSEESFTLDKHGFTFLKHESKVTQAFGSMEFYRQYLAEVIELLQKHFGADKVICYDLRVRKNVPKQDVVGDMNDRKTAMFTVQDVHIDQTTNGGFQRIMRHIREDEAMELDMDQWQAMIVNVWRPLFHQVEDAPLAFCDYRSVDHADLLAADRVYESYNGEIYYMRHNADQRWYYMSHQTPADVALFMSFMSDPEDRAQFCPHASFLNPKAIPFTAPRESIEVRAIVLASK